MDESHINLPSSYLLGSVPAVIPEEKRSIPYEVPEPNLLRFLPNNGGDGDEGDGQQLTNNWKGVFSVSSYTQYFNVDTEIVLNRLISSMNPISGDFFSKTNANPDLYGLVWISTTLVFVIASFGNCATYLTHKHSGYSTSWSFDVSYVNSAACLVYGYALVVPVVFYLVLYYMGANANLVHFWCMWGYSLFIFILSSRVFINSSAYAIPRIFKPRRLSIVKPNFTILLVIPVEFLRWTIILFSGAASACFVAYNLRTYVEGNDLKMVVVAAFVLQMGLALFFKIWFFP